MWIESEITLIMLYIPVEKLSLKIQLIELRNELSTKLVKVDAIKGNGLKINKKETNIFIKDTILVDNVIGITTVSLFFNKNLINKYRLTKHQLFYEYNRILLENPSCELASYGEFRAKKLIRNVIV